MDPFGNARFVDDRFYGLVTLDRGEFTDYGVGISRDGGCTWVLLSIPSGAGRVKKVWFADHNN